MGDTQSFPGDRTFGLLLGKCWVSKQAKDSRKKERGQKRSKADLVQGTGTILVEPGLNLEKAGCLAGLQAKHILSLNLDFPRATQTECAKAPTRVSGRMFSTQQVWSELKVRISNTFPRDAGAAGPQTTHFEQRSFNPPTRSVQSG